MIAMMTSRKRRRREDPLEASVNDVVGRVCAWEDACGGKFTVETETTVGTDFVELRVTGVDEVRLADLVELVEMVPHVVAYGCYFATRSLWFKFETDAKKKKRVAELEETPTKKETEEEYEKIRPRLKTETEEDVRAVCDLVVGMKAVVPHVHSKNVRVDLTPTPGVVVVNFKGLPRFDKTMITKLTSLSRDGEKFETVVFLAPQESQCVKINVKKRKKTVNII